jgi:hypothetical protein
MEKILRILVVFVLLMVIIYRFIRGREPGYRPYGYLTRRKPPLPPEIEQRLLPAVFGSSEFPVGGDADAFLFDAASDLLFCYSSKGSLTIFRRRAEETYKEMQWLAVPLNCTGLALDPLESRLYFEAEGSLFVYGAG